MDLPEKSTFDAFKSQQHDQLDDDKLFYGHLRKCRCCFMQLTEITGANIIHQWQRETFMAMTGLELSSESHHSNRLCLNCIEMLKIFTQMKVAADGMQKVQNRYIEHQRQLLEVVTVKQEVELDIDDSEFVVETDQTNDQSDENNIVDGQKPRADYYEQCQNYENENIKVEELNQDYVAIERADKIAVPAELIHELQQYSVELERFDALTIARYSSNKKRTNDSDAHTTTIILSDDSDSLIRSEKHTFSCNLCKYESEEIQNLAHHINSRHKQAKEHEKSEFKCPIDGCNKILKNKNSWYVHRYSVHKRDSQDKSTCKVCGRVCKNKKALWNHQQFHSKNFTCAICVRSFAHKTQLIDHMETYHNDSTFNCTKCSKTFKSQSKLKGHQRNSHDVKKFKCDQCNAAFTAPSRFNYHVKMKHEGKKYPTFGPKSE